MTRRSNPTSGQVGPKSPAIPGGLVIRELAPGEAVAFIRQYHYSKVMPRLTKHYLGFYVSGVLSGVVTLGWGTQPLQTIRKLFPRHVLKSADYLEIGKMCFLPAMNDTRFFGSLVLSALVKWTRENTQCHLDKDNTCTRILFTANKRNVYSLFFYIQKHSAR